MLFGLNFLHPDEVEVIIPPNSDTTTEAQRDQRQLFKPHNILCGRLGTRLQISQLLSVKVLPLYWAGNLKREGSIQKAGV